MLLTTPGLAAADPAQYPDSPNGPDGIAALIADVAEANQRLQDLGAEIQTEQESVNKALVDVETARDNADDAQREVEVSRQAVTDADDAIATAQKRFDKFAVATYVNGPSKGYLTVSDPSDIINTATAGELLAVSSRQVRANLLRARTEQLNKASAALLAKKNADQAVVDAGSSQSAAVSALTDTQRKFGEQQQQINALAAKRDEAQAKLDAARRAQPEQDHSAAPEDRWGSKGPAPARKGPARWDGEWDPTLPMIPSANIEGDPIAVINQVLGFSKTSAQVTQDMGRKFLQSLGLAPTDSGFTNGVVRGSRATEYVIRRGMSQIGVPYSWGGGNAAGPSRGIDSGAGTVGFDCSGLILYAFAGVGIKLPHYSGAQYEKGRKIPSSMARRGDVIFYGPGGSQHVALFLGGGKMLEAPDVGERVKVSPVRTGGMTPFVIRYID